MKFSSYWHDTAPSFTGGFTGLAATRAAARKGASVAVLEAGRVIGEASGRNGGQCNNGMAHDYAGVAATLGQDRARELYQTFDAGVGAVEQIVTDEVLARDVDPDVRLVSPADLPSEIASSAFHGGLIFPKSARLHMGKFGVGPAEAASRWGAKTYEHSPATANPKKLNPSWSRFTRDSEG